MSVILRSGVLAGIASLLLACSGAADGADGPAPSTSDPGPSEPATAPTGTEAELDFTKVILEGRGLATQADPSKPLTAEGALEDIRFFEFFIQYAYAAYGYRRTSERVDFDGAFVALKDAARGGKAPTAGALFDEMKGMLESVIQDAHVRIVLPGSKPARWVAVGTHRWKPYVLTQPDDATGIDPSTCKADDLDVLPEQTFVKVSGNAKQLTFLSRDPRATVTCGQRTLPVTELPPSSHSLPGLTERSLDSETYYVRLPSFSNYDPAQRAAFLATAGRARGYASVVLDLRGNPGGNPEIFVSWLEALGTTGTVRVPLLVNLDSFAAHVLKNNSFESILHDATTDARVKKEISESLVDEKASIQRDLAAEDYRRMVPIAVDAPHVQYTLSPNVDAYQGDVRILVDARCASACEWAAHLSKQLPRFAVLSDTNTVGALLSANPMPLQLPNSSILVYVPIGMLSRPTEWAREGRGVTPDVWVETAAMRALFP